MKRAAAFALVSVVLVGLGSAVLQLVYTDPPGRGALMAAAAVALATQAVAWVILQTMGRRQVIAAWGLGAVLRVLVLVVFALVAPRSLGLPLEPAALSLALFLFLTTLVEPLFLKS